jgi:outer membrane lipoprotein-sorting protein
VATGGTVYVKNARLNTLDHYDLSDTPLGLLLNEKIDLKTNRAVVGVDNRDGAIVVRARTSTNRNNSNITLVFDAPSLELRQWTVKDNQGGTTTVALQQPQKDVALEDSLFAVPAKAPGRVKQSRN